jgi:hypothetical protein
MSADVLIRLLLAEHVEVVRVEDSAEQFPNGSMTDTVTNPASPREVIGW